MNTFRPSHRMGIGGLTLCLALLSSGCNETGPEAFSIHGTWTGSVTQLELELTMVLIGQGETAIMGFAEMSSLTTGTVQGEVSGSLDGAEVSLTIAIDGAIVAGSLVFDGAFESEHTLMGTLSSGLLVGSWPITLDREQV